MEVKHVVLLRRSFLAGLGLAVGGLALALDEPAAAAAPSAAAAPAGLRTSVFLHIAPDGGVSIVCHRSEMGQGIRSSLPVLIADELGADMARVTILQADGDKAYGDQNTDGSRSVRNLYEPMRRVGAVARTMLIAAAAKAWRVPAAECTAEGHAVLHPKSKRSLDFSALVDQAAKLPVPSAASVALRPKSEFKRVGTLLPLLDGPALVRGSAQFGADIRLPGMLTAVIARPPVVGGQVKRYDPAPALAVRGVKKVVDLPVPTGAPGFQPLGGVAVLADTTWAAMRGRAALEIAWDPGPNAAYESASYKQQLSQAVSAPGKVVRKIGDVDRALEQAASTVEAEYHVPHLAHAAMEPLTAVAKVDEHGCEAWAPTQNPQAARSEVARALGIDESKVTVHVTFLGGGFGRKSKPDYVAEAALLARAAGVPVRVQWTREDDIQGDYFHTVSAQRFKAGLDGNGKVTAWLQRTAFPPISSTFDSSVKTPSDGELGQGVLDTALAVPNLRMEACDAKAHVRIGWLRSVSNIFHAFAAQSFIDEIAHARQADPRDVQLELLGPDRKPTPAELGVLTKFPNYGAPVEQHPVDTARLRHVIERVTELSGWRDARKAGRAVGLAAHRSFLTYVAVVAQVSKDARAKVKVDEVWIVVDAGTVINPDRAHAQMEGAVIFGMSLAFHGAITMRGGAVEQTNFRDYPVVRIPEAPKRIHVEIVKSDGLPGGIGEPGVPPVAPAITNAIFALTKTRIRELPLSRHAL